MMKKVTKRTVLEALVAAVDAGLVINGVTSADVRDYATNEIDLLDKKASKAKERAEKKKAEADGLTDAVYAAMTGDYETIADIAARVDFDDPALSVAKVGARLRKLVDLGKAEKTELKIKPEGGGKTVTKVGYRAIAND